MMIDPIADMLTRIRNASLAKKKEVLVPHSKIKFAIAGILVKEKFIKKAEIIEDNFKEIKIELDYQDNKPVISHIRKVSKPGMKIYIQKDKIKRIVNGFGITIISTSRGLMTNREARKNGIGGEVLCEVY